MPDYAKEFRGATPETLAWALVRSKASLQGQRETRMKSDASSFPLASSESLDTHSESTVLFRRRRKRK